MRLTFPQVHHSVLSALLRFDFHSEAHLFADHLFAQELTSLESPGLQKTHTGTNVSTAQQINHYP